ncbi:MAG: hypothetical protein HQL37_10605 [Alphaproteobacteria bacterium]|nr:hypothetical protein [Alphaproteobacteria bacterium]
MKLGPQHLDAIAATYEAALAPERWAEALDRLAHLVGATYASISLIEDAFPECHINATNKPWPAAAMTEYKKSIVPEEAVYWRALKTLAPQHVVDDTEFFSDRSTYDSLPMIRFGSDGVGC